MPHDVEVIARLIATVLSQDTKEVGSYESWKEIGSFRRKLGQVVGNSILMNLLMLSHVTHSHCFVAVFASHMVLKQLSKANGELVLHACDLVLLQVDLMDVVCHEMVIRMVTRDQLMQILDHPWIYGHVGHWYVVLDHLIVG